MPLRLTIDERDCTPYDQYTTQELRDEYMQLDLDLSRLKSELDLIEAELKRRDGVCPEHGEYEKDAPDSPCPSCEDNPPDPEDDDNDCSWPDDEDDRSMFAEPGGTSALRAASPSNPRNLPCPNCGEPNRLTPADRALSYQCNTCADKAERVGD